MKAAATAEHKENSYGTRAQWKRKRKKFKSHGANEWEYQIPKHLNFQDSWEPGGSEIHATDKLC